MLLAATSARRALRRVANDYQQGRGGRSAAPGAMVDKPCAGWRAQLVAWSAILTLNQPETPPLTAVLPKRLLASPHTKIATIRVAPILVESATVTVAQLCAKLDTRIEGLSSDASTSRLEHYGPNVLARDLRPGIGKLLWRSLLNPLVLLLAALATLSFATGDLRAGFMMLSMIGLSVGLKLFQEARADSAAAKLKAMISLTATVLRDGT